MTLNLKSKQGVEIFKKLAERADVIVENYRPDVKKRLGIDYDSIRSHQSAHRLRLASPASARTGRWPAGRASTRSRRAWAD